MSSPQRPQNLSEPLLLRQEGAEIAHKDDSQCHSRADSKLIFIRELYFFLDIFPAILYHTSSESEKKSSILFGKQFGFRKDLAVALYFFYCGEMSGRGRCEGLFTS